VGPLLGLRSLAQLLVRLPEPLRDTGVRLRVAQVRVLWISVVRALRAHVQGESEGTHGAHRDQALRRAVDRAFGDSRRLDLAAALRTACAGSHASGLERHADSVAQRAGLDQRRQDGIAERAAFRQRHADTIAQRAAFDQRYADRIGGAQRDRAALGSRDGRPACGALHWSYPLRAERQSDAQRLEDAGNRSPVRRRDTGKSAGHDPSVLFLGSTRSRDAEPAQRDAPADRASRLREHAEHSAAGAREPVERAERPIDAERAVEVTAECPVLRPAGAVEHAGPEAEHAVGATSAQPREWRERPLGPQRPGAAEFSGTQERPLGQERPVQERLQALGHG